MAVATQGAGTIKDTTGQTKRQRLNARIAQMDLERSSFLTIWQELGRYVDPVRGRFLVTDRNRGNRDNNKLLDGTATQALTTLEAGMLSGMSSPARPWFALTVGDTVLAERGDVKEWLATVTTIVAYTLSKAGFYQKVPLVYGDEALFGTAAMLVERDPENLVAFTVYPIGSYWLATDSRGVVNVFARELLWSADQLVEKFGADKVSRQVRELIAQNKGGQLVTVRMMIYPNQDHHPNSLYAKHKRWAECYWETATQPEVEDKFLRESGYDSFPVLCPRWRVGAEDVYGTRCPGMIARGDIKGLQALERRKYKVIDKQTDPALVGGAAWRDQPVSLLPSAVNTADEGQGDPSLRAIHQVNTNLADLMTMIGEHRARIESYFLADLFVRVLNDERAARATAEEIRAVQQEKQMAIGPVLDSQTEDLFRPLINMILDELIAKAKPAWDAGAESPYLPTPPEVLGGIEPRVEFISIIAQAQKAVGSIGLERVLTLAGQMAPIWPAVVDKIDADQAIDEAALIYGAPPKSIRDPDEVAAVREVRQQAAAAQQALDAAPGLAKGAKDLSQADLSTDSPLSRLLPPR